MIYNLVLASGSGTRMYPLSTEHKPKQFLELMTDNMMFVDTLKRFENTTQKQVVVTLEKYRHLVKDYSVNTIYMRRRKETVKTVKSFIDNLKPYDEDIIVQTPSDHHIEGKEGFDSSILAAIEQARVGNFVAIGVKPRETTSDYGYIKNNKPMIEKPTGDNLKKCIDNEYLWNTAIYIYRYGDIKDYFKDYDKEESFENAIITQVGKIKVIEGKFKWYDLGDIERYFELIEER